jgi:regulatory protein
MITALEVQERDPERASLYLDGRFAFGLSQQVVADAGLKAGDVLSAGQVADLLRREDFQRALMQAFSYLSYRPRTEHELRRYLAQKGHAPESVDAALTRLAEYHYLDDEVFALNWVENRQRSRPRGPRLLRVELAQKGVDRDVADRAIADAGADERTLAHDAAERKAQSLGTADYAEFGRKIGGFLTRRGFSSDVVWEVVRELWAERTGESAPPA